MIDTPRVSNYRAAEFIQFHRNVITILDANNPAALGISAQRAGLDAALVPLEEEFKQTSGSELTARLVELDLQRDRALAGITAVARGYGNHFEADKTAASQRLDAAITNYGPDIARLRYQQETGVIKSLVDDFSGQPALAAAVTTLGLDAWVTHLRTVNAEFDTVFVQRSQETAGDPSQVLAFRAAVSAAWETLKQHLEAHATLTPSAAYAAVISQLNSLIKDYNDASAGRAAAESPAPPAAPAP